MSKLTELSAAADLLPSGATAVPGAALPPAARRLLDHDKDMTPTMERHHGDSLRVRVLQSSRAGDAYRRRVILETAHGKPVLQGRIEIRLDLLPPGARERVLAGSQPLGGILRDEGVPHRSRPAAFFTLPSTPELEAALAFRGPATLCGRVNHLLAASGEILATVVEILPPADTLDSA